MTNNIIIIVRRVLLRLCEKENCVNTLLITIAINQTKQNKRKERKGKGKAVCTCVTQCKYAMAL